ncbi:MAG TPA: hypothetical protein DIT24_01985 [Synergistaceae bacterium]|nr:hypothetical protein [Synergistaceae bacterium]
MVKVSDQDVQRWTLGEAARAIGAVHTGEDITMPAMIRTDSREVLPGDLFIALRGERMDGHDFIEEALDRGAAGLVCRPPAPGSRLDHLLKRGIPAILSVDTDGALREMSSVWLARVDPGSVIGVTGTVGKTTTREMIRTVLAVSRRVHSPRKSYNTWIGCALTVLETPPGTDILLLELGMNHPGEIRSLAKTYHPGFGVITEVGPGHLEGLKSIRGVLEAKMELLESPSLRSLSYNIDNELLSEAIKYSSGDLELFPVGYRSPMYRIVEARTDLHSGCPDLVVLIDTPGGRREIRAELFGEHYAYGMAFATVLGDHMKIKPAEQLKALSSFQALPGRGKCYLTGNGFLVIDDSYNANPVSMSAALRSLSLVPIRGKKCAVLGGMSELGEDSLQLHRDVSRLFDCLDLVLLIGEPWNGVFHRGTPSNCRVVDFEDLQGIFTASLSPGDLVLFKGSRSFGVERALGILEGLR